MKHESPTHIQRSPVSASYLERRDPFPEGSVKFSRHSRHISRGGDLQRKGERNSRVVPPFPESPRCLSPFQGNVFSLHSLDFQAEDSSPMLTWILGYFWSLPRGVSPRLEWGHARALSSRAVAAVSRFPSSGSRDQWLSLEAFPRGFPTGLSNVPPWCESILGLKVEAVQG